METEVKGPAAQAGADRTENIKTVRKVFDRSQRNPDPLAFQVAFLIERYGLSPCVARLVIQLANIGGRAS
jgi:hypothetical protein